MSIGKFLFVGTLTAAVATSLTPRVDPETRERVRIQAHFDSVLGELRARDVAAMAQAPRANRERLIATLEAYRDRGLFPRNYDFPGQAIPYFVDRKTGVRCAVGHLIESTGRGDIVQRVAQANNNVYVVELSADTVVRGWLRENGLTLGEAARIQVPYMEMEPQPLPGVSGSNAGPALAALSFGSGSLALLNVVKNHSGKSKLLAIGGIGVGALSMLSGTAVSQTSSENEGWARTAIGLGAASAIAGTFRLLPIAKETSNRVSVSPTVAVPAASPARMGLSGRIRF